MLNPAFHEGHFFLEERLFYRVLGNPRQPPLLLLHGAWQSGELFERLQALALQRYLILPDLRGHGCSCKPLTTAAYTLERFAQDLLLLCEHVRTTHLRGQDDPQWSVYCATTFAQMLCDRLLALSRSRTARFTEVIVAPVRETVADLPLDAADPSLQYEACLRLVEQHSASRLHDARFWRQVAAARLVPPQACQALVALCSDPRREHQIPWASWNLPVRLLRLSPGSEQEWLQALETPPLEAAADCHDQ